MEITYKTNLYTKEKVDNAIDIAKENGKVIKSITLSNVEFYDFVDNHPEAVCHNSGYRPIMTGCSGHFLYRRVSIYGRPD